MNPYAFFTAQLRFVASRTPRESDEVVRMMSALERVADDVDASNGNFFVPARDLRATARALAGVAGFLQQHILPEVVAAENAVGERQVRWTIETCMSTMAELTTHAEMTEDGEGRDVDLTGIALPDR